MTQGRRVHDFGRSYQDVRTAKETERAPVSVAKPHKGRWCKGHYGVDHVWGEWYPDRWESGRISADLQGGDRGDGHRYPLTKSLWKWHLVVEKRRGKLLPLWMPTPYRMCEVCGRKQAYNGRDWPRRLSREAAKQALGIK